MDGLGRQAAKGHAGIAPGCAMTFEIEIGIAIGIAIVHGKPGWTEQG
jgi:hypothetical protein